MNVPVWVQTEIMEYVRLRKSGEFTIVFSDGGVRQIKKSETKLPPSEKVKKVN